MRFENIGITGPQSDPGSEAQPAEQIIRRLILQDIDRIGKCHDTFPFRKDITSGNIILLTEIPVITGIENNETGIGSNRRYIFQYNTQLRIRYRIFTNPFGVESTAKPGSIQVIFSAPLLHLTGDISLPIRNSS